MKPCCPSIVTETVSCLFHHSGGRPLPAKDDGAPLRVGPSNPPILEGPPTTRLVFHGSSEAKVGTVGRPMPLLFCLKGGGENVDGCRWLKSSLGSGSVFKAATCSTLTSGYGIRTIGKEGHDRRTLSVLRQRDERKGDEELILGHARLGFADYIDDLVEEADGYSNDRRATSQIPFRWWMPAERKSTTLSIASPPIPSPCSLGRRR